MRAINVTILVSDNEYEKMQKKVEGVWKAPEYQFANAAMCVLIAEYKMNPDRVACTSTNISFEVKL